MRWEKSLLAAGALTLLLSASSMSAVRVGAWVKTEKTLTQLLAEICPYQLVSKTFTLPVSHKTSVF